jgi:hypothetical protein
MSEQNWTKFPQTVEGYFANWRKGFNPVTGEQNLFKDVSDEMIFQAGKDSILHGRDPSCVEKMKEALTKVKDHYNGLNIDGFERDSEYGEESNRLEVFKLIESALKSAEVKE